MRQDVSDQTLHSFIDGELEVEESEAIVAQAREDASLAQRVCALRSLKDMVRLAYAEPPAPGRGEVTRSRGRLTQRCALGCLVLLAALGGWVARGLEAPDALASAPLEGLLDGYLPVSIPREADPGRVILHLDNGAPARMEAVLDQADHLLQAAERQGRPMQLEIIANSQGINLLRAGATPQADRISTLAARYPGVQWVACGQTLARFRSEGKEIKLIPLARTAPTAVGEIVTRLQQGWTYVRV